MERAPFALVRDGALVAPDGVTDESCAFIASVVSHRPAGAPGGEVLVAAQECPFALLESRDGGCTWEATEATPTSGRRRLLSSRGTIYAWTDDEVARVDDGALVPMVTFAQEGGTRFVGVAAEGELLVTLNSGGSVHRSRDGGTSWEKVATLPSVAAWSGLVGEPGGAGTLVATSAGAARIALSRDRGTTWTLTELPWAPEDERVAAVADGGEVVWVASASTLHRSDDAGSTFRLVRGVDGGAPLFDGTPTSLQVVPGRPDVVLTLTSSSLVAYEAVSDELESVHVDADFLPELSADGRGPFLSAIAVPGGRDARVVVGLGLY